MEDPDEEYFGYGGANNGEGGFFSSSATPTHGEIFAHCLNMVSAAAVLWRSQEKMLKV